MFSFNRRQLKSRVLDAVESRVKQFRRREDFWPLRIPAEPVLMHDVVEEALGDDARRFDDEALRSRTLMQLDWEDEASWNAWVIVLPSRTKVYCDSGNNETRLLASGGRNEGDESDRIFLQMLAESAGAIFGIELSGGAPTRVRSGMTDRAFLVNFFVNLFEVSGAEDSVHAALGRSAATVDFQQDVEEWLEKTLKS
jgi:hypothetical protein